jgi:hypothetical protein
MEELWFLLAVQTAKRRGLFEYRSISILWKEKTKNRRKSAVFVFLFS